MDVEPLWGASLVGVELDVAAHRLRLAAEVASDGRHETYELLLEGLTDLRFHSEIESPWTYAEMTEVRLASAPDDAVSLSITLWSEEASLSATGARVSLNGQPLDPS